MKKVIAQQINYLFKRNVKQELSSSIQFIPIAFWKFANIRKSVFSFLISIYVASDKVVTENNQTLKDIGRARQIYNLIAILL